MSKGAVKKNEAAAAAADLDAVNTRNKGVVPAIHEFISIMAEVDTKGQQELTAEIATLQRKLEELTKELTESQTEYDKVVGELDKLKEDANDKVQAEREGAAHKLAELQAKYDSAVSKCAKLQDEYKDATNGFNEAMKREKQKRIEQNARTDVYKAIIGLSDKLPVTPTDIMAMHQLSATIATRIAELQKFQNVLSQFLTVSSDMMNLLTMPDSNETYEKVIEIFTKMKTCISDLKKLDNPSALKEYVNNLCRQIDGVSIVTYTLDKHDLPFLEYNGNDNSTKVVIKLLNVLCIGCLNKFFDELNVSPFERFLKMYMFDGNCDITGLLGVITGYHKNESASAAEPAKPAEPAEPAKPVKTGKSIKLTKPGDRHRKRAEPTDHDESVNPDEHIHKRVADDKIKK